MASGDRGRLIRHAAKGDQRGPPELARAGGRRRWRTDSVVVLRGHSACLCFEGVIPVRVAAAEPDGEHGYEVGGDEERSPPLSLAHVDEFVMEDVGGCIRGEQYQMSQGDGAIAAAGEEPAGEAAIGD